MMRIKKIKLIFIFYFCSFSVTYQTQISATIYGSDTAVSIVNPMNIPTNADNIIKTFGCAKNGFGFADLNTSCSWQSIYPIAGPISLQGGKLFLMSDLIMNNTGSLVDLGTIKGANHVVELSPYMQNFSYGANPTGARAMTLLARTTVSYGSPMSIDWSYDNKYLAVATQSGYSTGYLAIYYFNGSSLTLRASANLNAYGNSVRWNPDTSHYYVAVASNNSSAKVRVYQFDGNTTLTLKATANPSGTMNNVAWQGRGRALATAGSTTLYAYPFNLTTGALGSSTSASVSGGLNYDVMCWAPTGSKDDLIIGTQSGLLYLFNYTGSALTQLQSYNYSTDIVTLDWAKTDTYIAIGYDDGNVKTYQVVHSGATNTLTYKNVLAPASTTVAQTVNFKPDATELVSCYDAYSGDEFIISSFNKTTYALKPVYGLDLSSGAFVVKYANSPQPYIARVDLNTNYLSVYKIVYNPFILENVNLFLNNGITLGSILTFSGNNYITGQGHKITVTGDGAINIAQGSSLEVKLTDLDFRTPSSFALQGRTSKLKFRNTNIYLESDVTLGDGGIDFYEDVTVTGPYKLQYQTNYTSTIHANSTLTFENGATFETGKPRRTTSNPIYFESKSSNMNFNNATLHVTNSGLTLTKGTLNIYGNSTFNIDWTQANTHDTKVTATNQGLVFGDGRYGYNDPWLILHGNGTRLSIKNGAVVLDCIATHSMLQFYGQPQLAMETTATIYMKRPLNVENGWLLSDTTSRLVVESGSYLTFKNSTFSPIDLSGDIILTGSVPNYYTVILDKNDSYNIESGVALQIPYIVQDGNVISGNGILLNGLIFAGPYSQLTWNSQQVLNVGNISLNGGRITIAQSSGLASNYTFVTSGSVDLMETTFDLGPQTSDWTGNIYWIGNGGTLKFNNDVSLSGIWTFSGDLTIDGNSFVLDVGTTGTIILERGANVTFKNTSLYNLSRQNRIICKDNNCQITLNYADLVLSGDYLFDKGSIFVYYDSDIGILDGLDGKFTFSYESTKSSTIDAQCKLTIKDGIKFSIGRRNSTITDINQQPLIFNDAASSLLVIDGGTLHITSSGMIVTSGKAEVTKSSDIEIENSIPKYGLILGDETPNNDFLLNIGAGIQLTVKSGKIYYKNYSDDKIRFGSPASSVYVYPADAVTPKTPLTLSEGTVRSRVQLKFFNPTIVVS